jgi:hypothetical protein
LPILGLVGGEATNESIVAELSAIIAATEPVEIHTLDLAATHGRDHSSHLMAASYAFWAMAHYGYQGPLYWHRGYNVAREPITLDGEPFERAKYMLGFFEACYFGCAPCGNSCTTLDVTHEAWLRRQYGSRRQLDVGGKLATEGGCLSSDATGTSLVDCASAPTFTLGRNGQLTTGGLCLASQADGSVLPAPCEQTPAQFWMLDGEGFIWNGRLPEPMSGMDYDHVRCLSPNGAPTCGANHQPRWQFSDQ